MEYVYAALLLHRLKQDVTEDNVKNVIKATGTSPDEVKVKALVAALSDVNIDEALKTAPVAISAPPSAVRLRLRLRPKNLQLHQRKRRRRKKKHWRDFPPYLGR